jgi:hypothetical protein
MKKENIEPKISFEFFIDTMKDLLVFYPGEEWDIDQWNNEYIVFKYFIKHWSSYHIAKKENKEQIISWANFYYSDESLDTHSYELKKNILNRI